MNTPHHQSGLPSRTYLVLMQTLHNTVQPQRLNYAHPTEHSTYLNLDIEHRMRINLETQSVLHVVCEPLLVALLHRRPLLLERGVIDVLQESLELRQILEEVRLGDLQSLLDEIGQLGVRLVEPTTGSDCGGTSLESALVLAIIVMHTYFHL